jgi:hypothetical protein
LLQQLPNFEPLQVTFPPHEPSVETLSAEMGDADRLEEIDDNRVDDEEVWIAEDDDAGEALQVPNESWQPAVQKSRFRPHQPLRLP